jgi:hypothetical protein
MQNSQFAFAKDSFSSSEVKQTLHTSATSKFTFLQSMEHKKTFQSTLFWQKSANFRKKFQKNAF